MRSGARRLRALYRRDYYAGYEPDSSLRLASLRRALEGRQPRAALRPFHQQPAAPDEDSFDVERAGEILAVAIARQLEELGWQVGLDADATVLPIATDEFPAIDVRAHPLSFRISGRVRFWVGAARQEDGAAHQAHLDARVRIRALRPDGPRTVYARALSAQAALTEQQEPVRGARARKAASLALKKWVGKLFVDLERRGALTKEAARR